MPLRLAVLITGLAQDAPAEYKLVHGPDHKDPMQVHIYELENGLTVYLTQNHEEPRFYAEIAVRAGSKHGPQDATGIAHYLEHMLFKGSRHLGTTEFAMEKVHLDRIKALYEEYFAAMGERGLNAHTGVEETVYKVDLPANRLDQWATTEADRFHHPVFCLFQTELETVYEEMNRALYNTARVIRYAVQEQLYKEHPYRIQTIGTVEHLKNPSLERMYGF